MNEYDKKLAYIAIPVYLLVFGLIFALSFLFVKVYNEDDDEIKKTDSEKILLSLKDISFSSYLQRNVTDQSLITFYEQPNEKPYIDIFFTYTTIPVGLEFRILDGDSKVVSSSRSLVVEKTGHSQWRYPFENNGSQFYRLQYSLSNTSSNTNNVAITRVELLT
jgi:hypothetical protein